MKTKTTSSTTTSKKSTQRKRLARQLAAYSVAAGTGLVAAENTEAAMIPVHLSGGTPYCVDVGTTISFDLNNDGISDFGIDNYLGEAGVYGEGVDYTIAQVSGDYLATVFGVGELIDGQSGFGSSSYGGLDYFFDSRGFVGIEFDLPGGTHYGYLDIGVDETTKKVTIYGGAYESQAGLGVSTVPEPTGLGLLAIGAAGLASWHRKREQ